MLFDRPFQKSHPHYAAGSVLRQQHDVAHESRTFQCQLFLSFFPTLNATLRVASLQRTNTLALNVSVQDHHVKKYGPFTDIYYGRAIAEALGAFASYTAAPVGPHFRLIEYISYIDPIRKAVAIKMVRFNHDDIKLRQEILSV